MRYQGKYADIIDLPHHTSTSHPRMPMSKRAAQFSPFAALTGYDDAVDETARLTDEMTELTEDRLAEIQWQLQLIEKRMEGGQPGWARITWFIDDEKKEGGSYRTIEGTIRKIDGNERVIIMSDGTRIPVSNVMSLASHA